MLLNIGIFLAALGITTLEMVEAAAVGLALYAESKKLISFAIIALGSILVFAPTFVAGGLIAHLPVTVVRLVGGVLLLYFGLRLTKSARRAVLNERRKKVYAENFTKGLAFTGISVGGIEAFEAAIVLIGLLPNNYDSTSYGFAAGIAVVVVSTYALRNKVRKIKQATTKVMVSSLLLTFSTFWFVQVLLAPSDLLLVPLFTIYAIGIYSIANRKGSEQALTIQR